MGEAKFGKEKTESGLGGVGGKRVLGNPGNVTEDEVPIVMGWPRAVGPAESSEVGRPLDPLATLARRREDPIKSNGAGVSESHQGASRGGTEYGKLFFGGLGTRAPKNSLPPTGS